MGNVPWPGSVVMITPDYGVSIRSRRRGRSSGPRRADGTLPVPMHCSELLEHVGALGGKIVSLARVSPKIEQKPWEESRLGDVLPVARSNGSIRIASEGTEPVERSVDRRPVPCEDRNEVDPVERPVRGCAHLRRGENGSCEVHGD